MQRKLQALLGRLVLLSLLALGGCASDPCDGLNQACLSVRVESAADAQSDLLRIFIRENGGAQNERLSHPPSGQATAFPIAFTVLLGEQGGAIDLDVVSELAGTTTLRGQGSAMVAAGEHQKLTVSLSADIGTLPMITPSPRQGAGVAYFPDRHSVVLFGGTDAQDNYLSDTWEYQLQTSLWTRIDTPSHPDARTSVLTYHPRRQALVLFGGQTAGNTVVSDHWIYDSSGKWSPVPLSNSPAPRAAVGLVYDTYRDALEVYGGLDPTAQEPLSDLWELPAGASAWVSRTPTGAIPVVPYPHLVFDGRYSLLVGSDKTAQTAIKVWRQDGAWTELPPPAMNAPPSSRVAFATQFDRQLGMLVLFGGMVGGGTPINETYLWAPTNAAWSMVTDPLPPARFGATLDYVPELGGLLLLEGIDAGGAPLGDRWLIVNRAWQEL